VVTGAFLLGSDRPESTKQLCRPATLVLTRFTRLLSDANDPTPVPKSALDVPRRPEARNGTADRPSAPVASLCETDGFERTPTRVLRSNRVQADAIPSTRAPSTVGAPSR
jgi:hypothetical protein